MIMASDTYVSLPQISEEFKLSKRSIYYELCKINDWLSVQGINEITVVRGKGIKLTEEEKQQAQSIGLEPEVVFNTLSDRRILAVQTEDTHETIMEISGYDLQINFNRDKLQNIADIESMLDGLKDLFRRVVMQDLLESNVEKTNS